MSRDTEAFVNVIFFTALIVLIFFLLEKKNEEIEKTCYDACKPLPYHVKYDGITYKCACEERNPGVIRFKDGR